MSFLNIQTNENQEEEGSLAKIIGVERVVPAMLFSLLLWFSDHVLLLLYHAFSLIVT